MDVFVLDASVAGFSHSATNNGLRFSILSANVKA
jgi:hypothetical protein